MTHDTTSDVQPNSGTINDSSIHQTEPETFADAVVHRGRLRLRSDPLRGRWLESDTVVEVRP